MIVVLESLCFSFEHDMHLFSHEVTTTVVVWLEQRPGEGFLGEGRLSPIRQHITPRMCAKLGFRLPFFVKHISVVYRPHNCFAINLNVPLVGLSTLFQFACYIAKVNTTHEFIVLLHRWCGVDSYFWARFFCSLHCAVIVMGKMGAAEKLNWGSIFPFCCDNASLSAFTHTLCTVFGFWYWFGEIDSVSYNSSTSRQVNLAKHQKQMWRGVESICVNDVAFAIERLCRLQYDTKC